jgi:hypothetical protein
MREYATHVPFVSHYHSIVSPPSPLPFSKCFGPLPILLQPTLGPFEFFWFYTVSGMFSSFSSNVVHYYAREWIPSIGASGSLFAILTYFCLAHPNAQISIFFIPMSASSGLALGTALNLGLVAMTLTAKRFGRGVPLVDGAGHLGGTIAGAAYYYYKVAIGGVGGGGGGGGAGGGWSSNRGGAPWGSSSSSSGRAPSGPLMIEC